MSDTINKAFELQKPFFEIVEARVEAAIANKKSVPATTLAKEIAGDFGMEWPQAYHLINIYVAARPELCIKKGPKGGITLREQPAPILNTNVIEEDLDSGKAEKKIHGSVV